mgnify:CR=1 FL=1
MTTEQLENAKLIQSQIELLKEKITAFDKTRKWVHLHVKNHHGNGSHVIETYAFLSNYRNAAGSELEDFIPIAYGEFLESVRIEMQKRIDFLSLQLSKL